jgi:lipopolysaccharide transport system ATP-binding protein
MSQPAIRALDLSKEYRIGAIQQSYDTFRDAIVRAVSEPLRRLRYGKKQNTSTLWALRDVSFEVQPGDVVGVIGRNGAGKSTLLKLLSRITEPTLGRIEIRGSVASLLEVGTGFHPELTGRENISLNGAILGMTRQEIQATFADIVEFAELEKFIDTPVKRYSSGMYMRLAFSVAAHLKPQILLVDEVLAVGDASFQRKCLGKMDSVAKEGRTVLFVSHNMAAVRQLCTRGVMLSKGTVVAQGDIEDVVGEYLTGVSEDITEEVVFAEREGTPAQFTRLCLRNDKGEKTTLFSNSEKFTLEIEYLVRETLRDDHIFVVLSRADGLMLLKAADDDGGQEGLSVRTPGRYVAQVEFPGGILNEGAYQYRVVLGKRRGIHHDVQTGSYFEIEDNTNYTESCFGKRDGVLLFPLEWRDGKAG